MDALNVKQFGHTVGLSGVFSMTLGILNLEQNNSMLLEFERINLKFQILLTTPRDAVIGSDSNKGEICTADT